MESRPIEPILFALLLPPTVPARAASLQHKSTSFAGALLTAMSCSRTAAGGAGALSRCRERRADPDFWVLRVYDKVSLLTTVQAAGALEPFLVAGNVDQIMTFGYQGICQSSPLDRRLGRRGAGALSRCRERRADPDFWVIKVYDKAAGVLAPFLVAGNVMDPRRPHDLSSGAAPYASRFK
ncbi:hypothetical protein B0H11DRAFT_2243218 [Mycena galericulata]|nr:hypothetical protein B0H11DRAFT_2243218 [Mycena galericulata]